MVAPAAWYASSVKDGAGAGAGLDHELQAHADESLDRIGRGRHPALVRAALFRDADLHFGG